MTKKKVKKIKIKWKAVLHLFLLLLVVGLCFSYLLHLKTRNIVILGNHYVNDSEIIVTSGFKNYPYLFRISTKEIQKRLKENPFIMDVKVHKSLLGELTLEIQEAKPLFFNRNNNRLILSNHNEVDTKNLWGVPILINYVPDTYYTKLIERFSLIKEDVKELISEIEYQPWKSNDVMIDETRFFLRMSDGNQVYTNLINMEKLNNYIEIYASLEGKRGILYLDSSSDKISFSEYK